MNGGALVFDPLLPWPLVAALALLAATAGALALWRGMAGWAWRVLAFAALILALANPSLQIENRRPLSDIALIVADESGSNRLSSRGEQAQGATAGLLAELGGMGIETRVVTARDAPGDGGTVLGAALAEALADLPRDRLAGVFIVSDGITHDAPPDDLPAPVHLIQTGEPDDWDRRIVVENAPAYGILGEELSLRLRIEDEGAVPEALRGQPVRIGYALNGAEMQYATAPTGETLDLTLVLDRGGLNVLHFVLAPVEGELTDRNNQAVVQINGIRDRLRVLLVSGEPHAGQRTWRNLLKSDPAVDLVHFTILRPPDRQDGVPTNELSLIAFPTRELFVEKIDEFDLIIMDRYRRRGILPNSYFDNIRRYVMEGGALLVVGGPELASAESISYSPLGRILPADPTARLFEEAFRPAVTERGERHPVTAGLESGWQGEDGEAPSWGRWLRQVDLDPQRGEVVMSGVDGRPLMVLDRVGAGRIAMLASDQAWLWDRGYEGGGPQAEMLRRLAHWMMGEPELEEEALGVEAEGLSMRITRRSMSDGPHEVDVTGPGGDTVSLAMAPEAPGQFIADWTSAEPGVVRLHSGGLETVAVLGAANPREYARVVAEASSLQGLIRATRGGVAPISAGLPDLRVVPEGRQAAGRGWLGVTPRAAFMTLDVRLSPLLPVWAWLILGAGLMLAGWLREARR